MRYGHLSIPYTFSRHRASRTSLLKFGPLRPGQPTPGSRYLYVSVYLRFGGYGISTVCASTTPFGLALAPGLPWADEPSPGNLRFSACKILTYISLLMPTFSLVISPPLLTVRLQPGYDALLPLEHKFKPVASVVSLSPGHFRRRISRLVSYYALFK